MGINNSSNKQIGNKENRQIIYQHTPINMISPICFHLHRVENGKDDSSLDAQL
jgi:hypothetical protein